MGPTVAGLRPTYSDTDCSGADQGVRGSQSLPERVEAIPI